MANSDNQDPYSVGSMLPMYDVSGERGRNSWGKWKSWWRLCWLLVFFLPIGEGLEFSGEMQQLEGIEGQSLLQIGR